MSLEITPASKLDPQLEIGEKPDDTPSSVTGTGLTRRGLALAVAATQVLNQGNFVDDLFMLGDMTGYRDEETVTVHDEVVQTTPEEEARLSAAESANQSRFELLARAYVGGQLSNEEQARLEIVTERVRRLIPRVTVRDFEELEGIASDLTQTESENIERRRRILSL